MTVYEAAAREIWKPWYEQSYDGFINAVKESVLSHINIFRQKNSEKEIYGYSLYTCNGLPHFGPVLNSTENYSKHAPDLYYKYCPDEWSDWDEYSCFEPAQKVLDQLHTIFSECNDNFEEMYEDNDNPINSESEDYWSKNVEKIFNALLQAMKELENEGAFDWLSKTDKFLIIWFSDPSDWEFAMSKISIESLLGEKQANSFAKVLR